MLNDLTTAIRLLEHEYMRRQLRDFFGEWLRRWQAPGSLLASVSLGVLIATALNFDKPSLTSELMIPTWQTSFRDCETELTPSPRPRTWSDSELMLANSSTPLAPTYKLSMISPDRSENFILGLCHHANLHQHRLLEESR
jgi:hypothetical protein